MSTEKIAGTSLDIEAVELEKLKAVFPQCFNEGKLDTEKLLSLVGEYAAKDREHYNFEWNGKNDCYRLAASASTATLRPCKDKSVNFDTTKNLYIEGDNLEVLKTLQKAYYGKVKMIYIDPPYNTGNDFVYEDDFKDPLAKYKELTAQATKSNPETAGRYHTNWLNMMFPRLRLAYNLLRDDGVIFISIDDNEVTNLRRLCDEVFGEENFVAQFPWRKRTAKSDVPFGVSQDYEWVLCYAKSMEFIAALEGGTRKYFETPDLPGRPWRIHDLTSQRNASERPNSFFDMVNPKNGDTYPANPNRTWAITKETFDKYYAENRIVFPGDYDFLNITRPAFRYFKEDDMKKAGDSFGKIAVSTKFPDKIGMSQDGTKEIMELFKGKIFGFPKPVGLIKYLIQASVPNDTGDIVLDFFSGSATTAHAVMELNAEDGGNRRFIMVQLPELCDEKSEAFKAGYKNICDIGEERIRRAGKKILEQYKDKLAERKEPLDIGFKVFALNSSNLVSWDASALDKAQVAELYERMDALANTIKKDRSDLDVVYEMMLKLCVPLDEPVSKVQVNGKTVWTVGADNELVLCLNENAQTITAEDIETLCKKFAPAKIVAAEAAFKDDSALSNAYFTLHNREVQIKLI